MFQQVIDRWQCGSDAGIIDDLITLQGYVEVHPHKDAFFIDIHISNCFFTEHDYLRALKT
jgi:hypothetical protein